MKPSSPAIAVFLGLLLHGGVAAAQTTPKSAEALFREGRQLMDAKDYATACPKFAESQKLEPAPGTLLNLADCYEKGGHTASAWTTFNDAAKAAAARNRADWVATATQRAALLEPKLATLAITVAGDLQTLRIERDGAAVERGVWGIAVPVDPGPHLLVAAASGKKTWTRKVDVPAGKNVLMDVPTLEADTANAAPPPLAKKSALDEPSPPAPAKDGSGMRGAGYIVAGLGVVGLAVGTVTGVSALGKRSDAEAKCVSYPSNCSGDATGANDDAKKLATISTVSLIAGGVLVAGGIVLIVIAPRAAAKSAALAQLLSGTF